MNDSISEIPIIDIFAGPGGLGEGFSSFVKNKKHQFKIKLSIEKEASAHKTLSLRSFYRQFAGSKVPEEYYDYVRGKNGVTRDTLKNLFPDEWAKAQKEAWLAELGSPKFPDAVVDERIKEALGKATEWVLIGGPPCQAYSLVGRARRSGEDTKEFEKDHRHFLYQQYLRILRKFKPTVFVMENVKGLLSSKIDDEFIFHRILRDLKLNGEYTIYSLTSSNENPENLKPHNFVIKTENYGVPQARHRVILLGIKKDTRLEMPELLTERKGCSSYSVLRGLPKLQSKLSRQKSTPEKVEKAIETGLALILKSSAPDSVKKICNLIKNGKQTKFFKNNSSGGVKKLRKWLADERLKKTVLNHVARGHMESDIHRYLFASIYAAAFGVSPRLKDFPTSLLPAHKNVTKKGDTETFADEFKVQVSSKVASTIVSHIAKDGHYYIHPDPLQCRSFTVREAARIQTFPDNYYFEGNRTQQYTQVGNAVPPYLAFQIAGVVSKLLAKQQQEEQRLKKAASR